MEGLDRGLHLNALLCNTVLSPCNVQRLSKWGGLDQVVYLQDSPNYALSVDFLKYIPPWQEAWISTQKKANKIMKEINVLLDLAPENVPKASWFLLKINFSKLSKCHIETQKYWMLVVDAALMAKALESAQGTRAKWVRRKLNTKIPSRKKLGIVTIEQQIWKDGMHSTAAQTDKSQFLHRSQSSLDSFVQQQPHPASIMGRLRSKKGLLKPDWRILFCC